MSNTDKTYWNNKGKHQDLVRLLEALIPASGSVVDPKKNVKLENFRKAANAYHDLYCNFLGNMARQFHDSFGIAKIDVLYRDSSKRLEIYTPMIATVEARMDQFILDAAAEQKIFIEDYII